MRKAFPLRIDERVLEAVRAWAADDLRSVNAQIEYLLVRALDQSGRRPRPRRSTGGVGGSLRNPDREEDGGGDP